MAGERVPVRTTSLDDMILIVWASREAVQPALHSWPMDRRAPAGKLGTMYPRHASMGRVDRSRRLVCVEVIVLLLGMVTAMGGVTISWSV